MFAERSSLRFAELTLALAVCATVSAAAVIRAAAALCIWMVLVPLAVELLRGAESLILAPWTLIIGPVSNEFAAISSHRARLWCHSVVD